MQLLNNKLDFIIEHLLPGSTEPKLHQDEVIDISASGLKFTTKESPDIGAFLKMTLITPGTVQYHLDLIAEVMRIEIQ